MRKIVAGFYISLDGVVEAPEKRHFPYFDDEMGAAVGAQMAESDALLMGRVGYQEWAAYWPGRSAEQDSFAGFINNVRKYVVSTTLDTVEWNNTTLLKGDLVEEITELKRQPGRNISMNGSATLVRSLLKHGLLDELMLMIHPVVVGEGQRLFEDTGQIPLALVSSTAFKTGALSAVYRPAAK
ncbi:dihydrofolate reductase family protein [Planobispora siamensis]|uniref:Pyrimidine reductase n=1 Tax=Planobispora siamensis TaxID=936338 RepID=A0A8J3SKC7_9ACTN|nr:dihydrofolate reductase family protein [Planobispora siamensis]GIH94829.1 pyrimidine reductase [Planobispora siamensis]